MYASLQVFYSSFMGSLYSIPNLLIRSLSFEFVYLSSQYAGFLCSYHCCAALKQERSRIFLTMLQSKKKSFFFLLWWADFFHVAPVSNRLIPKLSVFCFFMQNADFFIFQPNYQKTSWFILIIFRTESNIFRENTLFIILSTTKTT